MPKAAPWLATSCNLTIRPGTAIWCPSRNADSAQALVAASVTSANSPTPAQQAAGQATPARRPLAAAPGVDCSDRQTDVMSLNPTPEPGAPSAPGSRLLISQLTDVLRCKLQECFHYWIHKTPKAERRSYDRRYLERREVPDHLRTGRD